MSFAILKRFATLESYKAWFSALTEEQKLNIDGLDLNCLPSAEGLVLPTSIGGWLDLNGLTSAEGVVLPTSIGGALDPSEAVREEELWSKKGGKR